MQDKKKEAVPGGPVLRRAETMREFTRSLGISYDSAYRAARDGRLKVVRFGKRLLIPVAEIERVMSEGL